MACHGTIVANNAGVLHVIRTTCGLVKSATLTKISPLTLQVRLDADVLMIVPSSVASILNSLGHLLRELVALRTCELHLVVLIVVELLKVRVVHATDTMRCSCSSRFVKALSLWISLVIVRASIKHSSSTTMPLLTH